ncbi:MAG TPA: hypothetical protein VLJ68_08465 [Chitinophagaceae bacterium]|nr:hypothetical protein [Chitinophagaceae bacterium]
MKKVLSVLFVIASFSGRSQDNQTLLKEFLNSTDFKWVKEKSGFVINAQADLSRSFVTYEDVQGIKVSILNIGLVSTEPGRAGRNIGQVSAIKVSNTYRQLPRNARYLLMYRDYSAYDENSKSGLVRIRDLNYDGFLSLEAELEGDNIVRLDTYGMPGNISDKYNFWGANKQAPKNHYCDQNENGNVSWAECFNCLVESCSTNLVCKISCRILNFFNHYCDISMAAACVWISIKY